MDSFDSIYFVGAGGIGMAALERYFLARGKRVAGYDRTPSELTDALSNEGVEIVFDEDPQLIPDYCRAPKRTLVVYTPAVPADHRGLCYFRQHGFEVVKRAKVLGLVTENSHGLCFSGTHGKTTTSSMAAHILEDSGVGCNAFLGGVLRNYNSNFLLSHTSPYSVIEADEFARSTNCGLTSLSSPQPTPTTSTSTAPRKTTSRALLTSPSSSCPAARSSCTRGWH